MHPSLRVLEMIKTTRFCLILLFLIVSQLAFSQDVSVQLSFDTVYNGTGSFSGQKILRMRGYELQAVVAKVFGVQKNVVRIDEALLKKTFTLKIETKGDIWQTDLKPAFTKALKELSGASLEIKTEQKAVWVAYLPNNEAISKSNCLIREGVDRSVSETNGLWMGSCVTTQELTNKLAEWSDKIIINETLTNKTYDLTVRNKPWQDLVKDLDSDYGIVFTEEIRSVEMVYVSL